MTRTRPLLILSSMALAIHMVWIYPGLPEIVSTHFDGQGNPNGWMTKETLLMFEAALIVLVVGEFTLIPWLVARMPKSLINLPNKEYWLSDDRRKKTFSTFRTYFEIFGAAVLALFMVVNHFVYHANIARQNLSEGIWLVLAAFLLFVAVWLVRFVMEFRIEK